MLGATIISCCSRLSYSFEKAFKRHFPRLNQVSASTRSNSHSIGSFALDSGSDVSGLSSMPTESAICLIICMSWETSSCIVGNSLINALTALYVVGGKIGTSSSGKRSPSSRPFRFWCNMLSSAKRRSRFRPSFPAPAAT